jgi:hypothetical protein
VKEYVPVFHILDGGEKKEASKDGPSKEGYNTVRFNLFFFNMSVLLAKRHVAN